MHKFAYEELRRRVWEVSRKIRVEADGMKEQAAKALLMTLAAELQSAIVEAKAFLDKQDTSEQ